MPNLYVSANDHSIAYNLDPGGEGSAKLLCKDEVEAELRAIQYGLTEYYIAWQKELDSRQYEGEQKVASPSVHTVRELPPPVDIRCSNVNVVKMLYWGGIKSAYIPIITGILKMLKNVEHRFTYVTEEQNKSRRLLIK